VSADSDGADPSDPESETSRRRRRRGGRRRRKPSTNGDDAAGEQTDGSPADASSETGEPAATEPVDPSPSGDDTEPSTEGTRRRRRRRRRGEDTDSAPDDPANTVVRVRERRSAEDEITSVEGSTRLEAKKQRRRDGREAGRRRAPIVSESEFLARREAVQREMVIRQRGDVTQIAVVEDGVLVEHYVARESQTSLIGNVYLGRVQNVLPSMEAAFIDIGKGRNAVLYAGEVDWNALGRDGKPRKIEDALKSGQPVLVQVSKDPVGHKGARLTSQISLPGRFLVYVPAGQTSGISRKLPDTERNRLKSLMKGLLPEDAGVIIRTAAEGASEEQLTRDVTALTARWEDISAKAEAGKAPQLLYGEPDLMIKVVRDLFNEDFKQLVVDGDDAWDMVQGYVTHVAPDLGERLHRWDGAETSDVFAGYRIDEQIAKGLDRKVFLPSGGSLVIDRTEAMTVVDVNTGKFTGSGGNLEETVTKNNLEAAEEMVRQLRLRDIGGIIVIDFIDMVLESNRDLVLRRLVECLGRDRTRHQVAEVTSLGLVQMTRKRIGTGLLEAFSEPCQHCQGRGHVVHSEPVEQRSGADDGGRRSGRRGKGSEKPVASAASDGSAASHADAPVMADATLGPS
jgi:ribonuclease E